MRRKTFISPVCGIRRWRFAPARRQCGRYLSRPERDKDDGPLLAPEGGSELGGHVCGHSAQHGAAPLVLHAVKHQLGVLLGEQLHGGEQLFQLAFGILGEQTVELLLDDVEVPGRGDEESGKTVECFAVVKTTFGGEETVPIPVPGRTK